ncbi:DUF5336 domain-containing protein [Streptomyces specialis]|uniref:DUF5336 domain-containing protein n=1 Tax=Streptomyces specialis TaxID=498367 RepID=UPI00073E7B26|nr:DUF5336 domain-containing protein [Streptomyces specialis]
MNNRSLSRGDAAVIGAAVLLFIASFLEYYGFKGADDGRNGWSNFFFPLMPTVFLGGLIAAVLIVVPAFVSPQVQERLIGGLKLRQWGTALAVFAAWSALWMLFANPLGYGDVLEAGAGMVLSLIAVLLLAAAAVLTQTLPALQVPLTTSGPRPQVGLAGQPPYGGQTPGYGYPAAGNPQQAYQPTQAMPATPAAGSGTGTDPNFQPFWFAVPAARPLYGEDGSPTPVAELAPGTWYLAVEQRGQALVAQTQDGRRGVLQDTSGIQRG